MLDVLATPVGALLALIHSGLSTFLIPSSGPAWALSIVLLTITVRLLLFPLFVKQIKSQRRMQQIAPMVKELQKKHKGDRETLNTEMMKLYKQNNANPISGCLPLLLQLPVFFALFTVIRDFKLDATAAYGLSTEQLREGAAASVLGAPISAAFNSPASLLTDLGAEALTVRVVAFVMVVGMGASTFWTQRQMIARTNTTDPQQIMVQKLLLYVLPLSFAVSGVFFPIGVLLYWLTTNVWSMGQQAWVIKRMPPVVAGAAATGPGGAAKPDKDAKDAKGDKLAKDAKDAKGDKLAKDVASAHPAATTGSVAVASPDAGSGDPGTTAGSTSGASGAAARAAAPAGPGAAKSAVRTTGRRQAGSRKNKKRGRR